MKKIVLFLIFLLSSCGYEPIFSSKNSNILIEEIIYDKNDRISSKIKNGLNFLTSSKNYKEVIKLEIKSGKKIEISSKDTKGDPLVFKMTISCDLEIFSNDKLVRRKNISKDFSYNNISNKFNLKQYEKTIEENLIDIIKDDIILTLYNK
tara:strand:- start:146 stop:595 length:450 start_codon:yes stop_codon:yes gene_type:complete